MNPPRRAIGGGASRSSMPEATTKICPECAETIRAAAQLCPCCQSPLTPAARWRPVGWAAGAVAAVVAAAVLGERILEPSEAFLGRDFARHRSELGIVRTSLDQTRASRDWWLSGFVTNRGPTAWRVKEFEVRQLDAAGRLLDASHAGLAETFVVLPGREHAFRLNLGTRDWTNATARCETRVQLAIDPRVPSSD